MTRQVEAAGFQVNTAGGQIKVSNVLRCTEPAACECPGIPHTLTACDYFIRIDMQPHSMGCLHLQVSPDEGLLQSSTMADTHVFRFAGGAHSCCYAGSAWGITTSFLL